MMMHSNAAIHMYVDIVGVQEQGKEKKVNNEERMAIVAKEENIAIVENHTSDVTSSDASTDGESNQGWATVVRGRTKKVRFVPEAPEPSVQKQQTTRVVQTKKSGKISHSFNLID
jgi:hypothetical protein